MGGTSGHNFEDRTVFSSVEINGQRLYIESWLGGCPDVYRV